MTKLQRVNHDLLNRVFIGFDSLLNPDLMDASIHQSISANYPPHNLFKPSETDYIIEIAVTGFAKDDVSITRDRNQLIIRGIQPERQSIPNEGFIHRGLALRNFEKAFTLGENIEITSASIDLGILTINLSQIIPEEQRPKLIPIS